MRRMGLLVCGVVALNSCKGCTGDDLGNLTAKGRMDPSVYSFGVVRAGATCTATVKLRDEGQLDMTVQGTAIQDDSNGVFSILSAPASVPADGAGEISVQYHPTQPSTGLQSATLLVNTNSTDNGGKVTGVLSGEAVDTTAGKLMPRCRVHFEDADEVSPCVAMDFGITPKGLTKTQEVTLVNDGTAPIDILAVQVVPDGTSGQPEFTAEIVGTTPVTLNPSRSGDCGEPISGTTQTVQVSITFSPTQLGVQTGQLQIISTAPTAGTGPGNPPLGQSNVTLTAMASGVGLTISPEFIAFGTVSVGQTSTQSIRVANAGSNPASVNTSCIDLNDSGSCYTVPGCTQGCTADPEDLECVGGTADPTTGLNCDVVGQGKGFPLAATDAQAGGADEVTMNVSWTPTQATHFSKDLLLMTNIPSVPKYVVHLTGGVAGQISANPGQLLIHASGDVINATGTASLAISNVGQADLVINRIHFRDAQGITDDFSLKRAGNTLISCSRPPNPCTPNDYTTPITIAPTDSVTFDLDYADNDPALALDTMTLEFSHNGNGGNPFAVDVSVCKPAGSTPDGGMGSNRPVCP